jgi:peptide deformylase
MDHLDGVLFIDKAQNLRPAATDEERAEAEAALAR